MNQLEILNLVITILQMLIPSLFFSFFFQVKKKAFKVFVNMIGMALIFMTFSLLSMDYLLIRNIMGWLGLFVLLKLLYKEVSAKKIFLAELFFFLASYISESGMYIIQLTFFHTSQEALTQFLYSAEGYSFLVSIRALAALVQAVIFCLVLLLLSRKHIQMNKLYTAVLELLLSSCITILGMSMIFNIQQSFLFILSIMICAAGITLLLILAFRNLLQYSKAQAEVQAREILTRQYCEQLQLYLEKESSEQKLREFRHDLLNFLQSEEISQKQT